jgi:hypothetical protein
MNIYLVGTFWVLATAVLAALVTIPVHRLAPGERNAGDAVSGVFTIVAGLQAVLLAFVLISLFDTVDSVTDGAATEADSLVAVYWASDSLPAPVRDQVQQMCRSYARSVIGQEWPRMRDGQPVGGTGWELLERMRVAVDRAAVESDWQQQRRSTASDRIGEVYRARQARLAAASGGGVGAVVWLALVVGAVLSVSLAYLFDVPKVVTHMVVVGALAATIALLLFAIYQLQNPFSGGTLVPPDAFASAVERMPST